MKVARFIRVRCTNEQCPRPADAQVPVEIVAEGVISRPRLLCHGCDCELQEVEL